MVSIQRMDKTVMNNVEKTININYMILIKLANFEQKTRTRRD